MFIKIVHLSFFTVIGWFQLTISLMIIVWFYDAVPEEECYIGKKISTHEELCNASIPESE